MHWYYMLYTICMYMMRNYVSHQKLPSAPSTKPPSGMRNIWSPWSPLELRWQALKISFFWKVLDVVESSGVIDVLMTRWVSLAKLAMTSALLEISNQNLSKTKYQIQLSINFQPTLVTLWKAHSWIFVPHEEKTYPGNIQGLGNMWMAFTGWFITIFTLLICSFVTCLATWASTSTYGNWRGAYREDFSLVNIFLMSSKMPKEPYNQHQTVFLCAVLKPFLALVLKDFVMFWSLMSPPALTQGLWLYILAAFFRVM